MYFYTNDIPVLVQIIIVYLALQVVGSMSWWFYILFNSISVISGEWEGDHDDLCAMKHHLDRL